MRGVGDLARAKHIYGSPTGCGTYFVVTRDKNNATTRIGYPPNGKNPHAENETECLTSIVLGARQQHQNRMMYRRKTIGFAFKLLIRMDRTRAWRSFTTGR